MSKPDVPTVWFKHDGGECPVASDKFVQVDLGDVTLDPNRASEFDWSKVQEYRMMPDAPSAPLLSRPCTVFLHDGPGDYESRKAIRARYDAGSMTITKGPALAAWLAEAHEDPRQNVQDAFLTFMARWLVVEADAGIPTVVNKTQVED